jgi:conjugal transfer mating pair stabilization protein TraG
MRRLSAKRVKRYIFLRRYAILLVIALVAVTAVLVNRDQTQSTKINPVAYEALLDTIAEGESRGNYNAYYGNANNTQIRFTEMSIGQVIQWQRDYVASGQPSSAAGRYQIIRPTLEKLVNQLKIDQNQKFDEAMQDKMAITLIENQGSLAFVNDQLSRDQFAANIAKEWAALPKIIGSNPEQSYYHGDGLNTARVTIPDIYGAVNSLRDGHQKLRSDSHAN